MYFAWKVGDILHGDWWKVCGCLSEKCIKWQQKPARNQSHLRRQTFRTNPSTAREKIQTRTMAYQQKKQQQKRKVSLKKGTGGGKARRKLVFGEPQPCPGETDLNDTLELEELLQLLKDGEDQPPARPSTPTDPRDTNTFDKDGSVETLRRAQNVVNAGASTSFTPGIVGGEEPPSRQNTNDSGSDLFAGGFHTSLGENSTEVRLPLHDNVFITVGVFKDRPSISVRQFYSRAWDPTTLRPGKKGLSLTPAQWTTLKDLRIYEAVNDITFSALPPTTTVKQHMFNLVNLRYAVVELIDGQPSVGLWQYERRSSDTTTDNDDDLRRTEKGINLSLQQWQAVEGKKKAVDWIMSAVVNGKSPLDSEVLKGIQF
ncbi:uncharacterized protein LOC144904893 [Branchiostoma floridae x Branchiostoma belcheri]